MEHGVANIPHLPPLRSAFGRLENRARVRPAPLRYRVRQQDGRSLLTCVEAPTLAVRFEPGVTVQEAAARSAEPGTIFLDGAAAGAPFTDPKRGVYNLDHHEGCVRSFTLATCEQAMVLVCKLQDLRKRDWTIRANDADLDAVLAIWVLFNHLRLNDDARVRARVMPLLRLEGAIDARGLDMLDFLALPEDVLQRAQSWMDQLRELETELRKSGRWGKTDLAEYTAGRLHAIDELVYAESPLEELAEIDELERVTLADSSVAVACRSPEGIYEVEGQLRRFHGDRLGVIVLQVGPRRYSLRQVDASLSADLEDVYEPLNRIDPAAGGPRSGNRWGGSAEIGGSPRGSGTRLALAQIMAIIARAHEPVSRRGRLASIALAALAAGALVGGCLRLAPLGAGLGGPLGSWLAPPQLAFGVALGVCCGVFLGFARQRAPGLYGLWAPVGGSLWLALPVALVGALLGGVWAPGPELAAGLRSGGAALAAWLGVLLLLPICAEVVFRGLVQGILIRREPERRRDARLPSRPALISAALYAPWAGAALLGSPSPLVDPPFAWLLPIAGAFLFGVAAGVARERSHSLLPPVVLHWLGVVALLAARALR